MNWIAWTVFSAFLLYVVADGVRRGRKQKDLDGYYAGGRSIPWWAAGLSVMATQASAITVIGTTGQGHETGMEFLQVYYPLPLAMVLLCIFFIPLYRKNPILTAYEYLEGRFGPLTRSLASLIFLVSRCLALGVVIYAPSVVLSSMTGLDLLSTVLIMGLLTTFYTFLGGISAVVWTDVKQMTVILGGLFICLFILLSEVLQQMDFGEALRVMGSAGKLNAVEPTPESSLMIPRTHAEIAMNPDGVPSFWEKKYNLWSGLFGGLFLMLAYFGCDQSQVQRILTNPNANESRKALLLSAFAKIPMQALVLFIGALLYLFHLVGDEPLFYRPQDQALAEKAEHVQAVDVIEQRYATAKTERRQLALLLADAPDDPYVRAELVGRFQGAVIRAAELRREALTEVASIDAEGNKDVQGDTNYIFPHFILNNLHPLLLGLVIAAIFAAAMSSIDSVLNSLSAATVVDFYKRWIRQDAVESQSLRVAKGATLFWGLVATIMAVGFEGGGSVIELVNRVGSYFYGSLLGIFTLGMICPAAKARAGLIGLAGGMLTVLAVHLSIKVEFLWYNLIGWLGVLAVGFVASRFERR
ncbi:MAG: sodium:solute symporter family protein [Planctomycetota bacterium]|jgi:SSS family transporter